MKISRFLISILACMTLIACGVQGSESDLCLDGKPCVEATSEQALGEDSFARRYEITPDINPAFIQRIIIDEESSMSEDGIVAFCNEAAEEVIEDCERAERSTERCELRGSWTYSGCKVELVQSNSTAE